MSVPILETRTLFLMLVSVLYSPDWSHCVVVSGLTPHLVSDWSSELPPLLSGLDILHDVNILDCIRYL